MDLHLHLHLHPQNVFVASDGSMKLGDFGLSKQLAATNALAKTLCGTPLYMSPELCAGETYNRAADVWALGCVLFEVRVWVRLRARAVVWISARASVRVRLFKVRRLQPP